MSAIAKLFQANVSSTQFPGICTDRYVTEGLPAVWDDIFPPKIHPKTGRKTVAVLDWPELFERIPTPKAKVVNHDELFMINVRAVEQQLAEFSCQSLAA